MHFYVAEERTRGMKHVLLRYTRVSVHQNDFESIIMDKVNFQLMMRFIRTVFHSFTLDRGVRYGLLVYGSSIKVLIYLFIYLFTGYVCHSILSTLQIHVYNI